MTTIEDRQHTDAAGNKPEDAPEALPELDLHTLLGAHGEQFYCLLESAELRSRLVLMRVLKAAAGTLLFVLAAFSAWVFLVAALLSILVTAGAPVAAALLLGGLIMALTTTLLWKKLTGTFQHSFVRDRAGSAEDSTP